MTKVKVELDEVSDRDPPRCGWCCWRPDCLQPCYKWQFAFGIMCWYSVLYGFILHGITPVNSSSLERRFKISSVEVGWFNSVLELSAGISAIFFSYLADRSHRPRWLMLSAFLFAVGCFVMALPHFIAEPYDASQPEENLCRAPATGVNETSSDCSGVSWWLDVLIAGNAITGIGAGMIYTVGIAFVDDFSDAASSSFRMAVMFLFSAVGAAIGFAGGSALLLIDVNFNNPDWPQFEGSKDFNPHYVGAWWLGYILGTIGFASVAFLFSCLDYEMVEAAEIRLQKTSETHKTNVQIADNISHRSKIVQYFLKFAAAFLKLCMNPVFILITLAVVTHGLISDGVQPFFVKILRTQFVISESKAGISIAILIVLAVGLGHLSSGLLIKKGKFTVRTLLLIVCFSALATAAFGFGLFLRCQQEKIVGITAGHDTFDYYPGNKIPEYSAQNLISTCNSYCGCSSDVYEPICHPTLGVQFFSPCFAGCQSHITLDENGDEVSQFTNCTCLAPLFFRQQNQMNGLQQVQFERSLHENTVSNLLSEYYGNFSKSNILENGVCDNSCVSYYAAMVILFLILFCGYFIIVPISSVVLRCVDEQDRAFAMAVNSSMERFLGAIPGPIMVGSIIDRVCIFREPTVCSDDEGSCYSYDSPQLARWLVGIIVGLHLAAALFYVIAFFLYKPPSGETIREYFKSSKSKARSKESSNQIDEGTIHDNSAYTPDEISKL